MYSAQDQVDLMEEFGVHALYYQAYPCSCVANEKTGGRFDTKDDCYFGFRYKDPIEYNRNVIIRTALRLSVENANLYRAFEGGANFTVFKKDLKGEQAFIYENIGHFDVIVNLADTIRKAEYFQPDDKPLLKAFNVKSISSISVKKEIINPEDYTYNADKLTIEWKPDKTPKEPYAVSYICNTNYLIYNDAPITRGAQDDSVPRKVTAILRPFSANDGNNPFDKFAELVATQNPENVNIE